VEKRLSAAFGSVIQELRLAQGMSQEALSFAAGRHRTYVSLLERGRNSPSLDTLWLLSQALDIAPTELIRRVEKALQRRPRAR
jgi:transcriptional regulator with XRE-family HTH domain